MFCPKCGCELEDNAKFCSACGENIVAETPATTPATVNMKWYKFLVVCGLYIGAVLNLVNGIQFLTGSVYDGAKDFVYAFFPDLKGLDLFVGIALIALAGLGVYTRFQLAAFKKNAYKFLMGLYIGVVAIDIIYVIAASSIVSSDVISSSVVVNIVVAIAMCIVNFIYFKNRKDMFVND